MYGSRRFRIAARHVGAASALETHGAAMSKNLCYAITIVSVALISAGVTKVTVEGGQAAAGPVVHPNPKAIEQPRVMKKNELFSQGASHTADIVDIQQVWAAYAFYNDSANGEGVASLFTEDGVLQHLWSDKGTHWEPHGGVGTFQTTYGPRGGGCVLRGRKQIAQYFGTNKREALPWPAWSHHTTPNILIKINDDGKTAILTTPYVIASTNDKGESRTSTGGYRVWFRKTGEGWQIAEQYNLADRPRGGTACDDNGPLPRPQ